MQLERESGGMQLERHGECQCIECNLLLYWQLELEDQLPRSKVAIDAARKLHRFHVASVHQREWRLRGGADDLDAGTGSNERRPHPASTLIVYTHRALSRALRRNLRMWPALLPARRREHQRVRGLGSAGCLCTRGHRCAFFTIGIYVRAASIPTAVPATRRRGGSIQTEPLRCCRDHCPLMQ